ncbi:MAG TPA: substrate-binding domain-containing protein [Beijerinckiaceae bacterium]
MRAIGGVVAALILAPWSAGAAELRIVGTGDGIDLLRALGAAYTAEYPDVTVVVPPSIGSGGGIAAVGSGREVLARVARPLSEGERAQGLVGVPLMRLPSAIFVHPSTGVTTITAAQLADIYAGKITNWSEVGGADARIKVVRREDADSTLTVLRQTMPGWNGLTITDRSKLATTTQEAISTVETVPGAIGFGPYGRHLEPALTVLRIDGHHPLDPSYPSAVLVGFVHRDGALPPPAQDFVSFAASPKAKAILASLGGLPAER